MDPRVETAGRTRIQRRALSLLERGFEAARSDLGPALVGSVLPFALVFYLALRGGGYDSIVYGEVGVAVWWLLLLGALLGVLPAARITRGGWVALGLLSALVAWTALGIAWSESAERSAAEAGRVAAYLGVFALTLATQRRDGLRRTVNAVAAAIAFVAVLALLSRLHPGWFPANDGARLLPEELGNRLSYPLNYWNGLAALMAMGTPLVLGAALHARHILTRALAAAALPVLVLTAFYTFSRGGALAMGVAVLAFLALHPRRALTLLTLGVSGAGGALLIGAATQRNALENHVLSDVARTQGDEMLGIVLIVCAGVGLVQVAISLAVRHGVGPRPTVSGRRGAALAAGAVAAAVAIALFAGLPGELADPGAEDGASVADPRGGERLQRVSIENRADYWKSALDASGTAPLTGIGAGTFEYWYERHAFGTFVRDAHSLYLETLAELGIVGLALVLSMIATVFAVGIRRTVVDGRSALLASAVAACVAFTVAAAVDWVWELPVLPVAFFLLAAAILGPAGASDVPRIATAGGDRHSASARRSRIAIKAGASVLAAASLIAIATPLAGTALVRKSEDQRRSGQLDSARDSAATAGSLQPYAATPEIQQALALERSGAVDDAVEAAREATRKESTNWRTWLLLSDIEAERGRAPAAAEAYYRAQTLNARVGSLQGTNRPDVYQIDGQPFAPSTPQTE